MTTLLIQNATCIATFDHADPRSGAELRNASLFITWKPQMGWYAETGLTLVGDRYADNLNTVVLPGYGRWT